MTTKPTKNDAINAVKTLLEYIGENTNREGVLKTPERVVKSYQEIFSGYEADLDEILNVKFFEVANFQDIILLKNISFKSMCEHHMLPIIGSVDIAYVPNKAVVGISKLARVVDAFARRLQIQEKMTAEIAEAIDSRLVPKGVAVKVSAIHHCMSLRGVLKEDSIMTTLHYTGIFKKDEKYKNDFLTLVAK